VHIIVKKKVVSEIDYSIENGNITGYNVPKKTKMRSRMLI
jgi:hypothetical protein